MRIADFTQGRDNNFNLIRMIAALMVLIDHSPPLSAGPGNVDIFRDLTGITKGSIAVDIFFITSGFLVTASLLSKKSAIDFIWARFLRIFPALLTNTFLTVFCLGVFFTSLPLSAYLTNSSTYLYLLKCSTLITGITLSLPGVFTSNPYGSAVNGSLWTMPYELKMYAILAVIWILMIPTSKYRPRFFGIAMISACIVAMGWVFLGHEDLATETKYARLYLMFFYGAAFYILKANIILMRPLFWALLITLPLSLAVSKQTFFIIYLLTIPYILFYIAYIPAGQVRKYNSVGDYSYGLYIYAFPVQQSVAALVPGVSTMSMIFISSIITIILAAISWHLLEKKALGLKGFFVKHTRNVVSNPFRQQ